MKCKMWRALHLRSVTRQTRVRLYQGMLLHSAETLVTPHIRALHASRCASELFRSRWRDLHPPPPEVPHWIQSNPSSCECVNFVCVFVWTLILLLWYWVLRTLNRWSKMAEMIHKGAIPLRRNMKWSWSVVSCQSCLNKVVNLCAFFHWKIMLGPTLHMLGPTLWYIYTLYTLIYTRYIYYLYSIYYSIYFRIKRNS